MGAFRGTPSWAWGSPSFAVSRGVAVAARAVGASATAGTGFAPALFEEGVPGAGADGLDVATESAAGLEAAMLRSVASMVRPLSGGAALRASATAVSSCLVKGGEVVDFDARDLGGIAVFGFRGLVLDRGLPQDGEVEAVRGEREVLAGAHGGGAGGAEEDLAVVGLVDADFLSGDLAGCEVANRGRSLSKERAAQGEPARGGRKDEAGVDVGLVEALLPHEVAVEVEAGDRLVVLGPAAAEGNEFGAADKGTTGVAGAVPIGDGCGFPCAVVKAEGDPTVTALVRVQESAGVDG